MYTMSTQHFCHFLKAREEKRKTVQTIKERCLFCRAKLSRYNPEDTCAPCQERIRDRELGREGRKLIEEEGAEIVFRFKKAMSGGIATLWRECRGICRGGGETIFGEIRPREKTIRIEKTYAISSNGKCGKCGGEICLFNDLVPAYARDFRVVIPRSVIKG